ncbi:MAG: hypothetical protein AAF483_01635 [Planctomycetota bacterium]
MRMHTILMLAMLMNAWFAIPEGATASGTKAPSNAPTLNQADAAKQLADKVASVIGNSREVFVREFRGFGDNHIGLAKLVGDALSSSHRVTIRRGAEVEVEGRLYRFPKDASEPLEGYTISATVALPQGERRFELDVENRDEGHIVVGKSGEKIAPPNQGHGSLPSKEAPFLDGHVIRPSKASPYGVEFLKEKHGRYEVLEPILQKGTVSIRVHKGDLIACRLHNASGVDAAANVLVDGLSRFALSDDPQRKGSLDLVPNAKSRTIKGYFRNTKHVDAFCVGEYSKSVAAKLLPEGQDHGTFTVAFRAAWEEGKPIPPNEKKFETRKLGIEQGPQRDDRTRQVHRNIGAIRAIVKVFYGE